MRQDPNFDKRIERLTPLPVNLTDDGLRRYNHNWSGTVQYESSSLHFPRSSEALARIIKENDRVKVLGTGHAFSRIADTTGAHISLDEMKAIFPIDHEHQTVSFEAGVTFKELAEYLERQGYAIANYASLPHISIAGAIATATHGSGEKNGSLATLVREFELVDGRGEVHHISKDKTPDLFAASVVSLGVLGVVTRITLDILPRFTIRQDVYKNVDAQTVLDSFDEVQDMGYSVSLFTKWQNPKSLEKLWIKSIVEDPAREFPQMLFGGTWSNENLHPCSGESAERCTPQCGVSHSANYSLPHFLGEETPSSGNEIQTEFFVPRSKTQEAMQALLNNGHIFTDDIIHVSEVRTIAPDNHWMSPFYEQESVGIHFTWKNEPEKLASVISQVQKILQDAIGDTPLRAHWAKVHNLSDIRSSLPRFDDFRGLIRVYDPQGKFRNGYSVRLFE